MSWVSYNRLKSFGDSIRNKFTTNEMVLANADKSVGAHLNLGGQDGLVTMSPLTDDGVTPASLWVTDSEANNATELTGGTLSYVTDVGKDTEDYTSVSLVGGVVNVGGKDGAQKRITNVADPVNDNDAVNKGYLSNIDSNEKLYSVSPDDVLILGNLKPDTYSIVFMASWIKYSIFDYTFIDYENEKTTRHKAIKFMINTPIDSGLALWLPTTYTWEVGGPYYWNLELFSFNIDKALLSNTNSTDWIKHLSQTFTYDYTGTLGDYTVNAYGLGKIGLVQTVPASIDKLTFKVSAQIELYVTGNTFTASKGDLIVHNYQPYLLNNEVKLFDAPFSLRTDGMYYATVAE